VIDHSRSFHVSDVRVVVECDVPGVLEAFEAVWGGASEAVLPERRRERFGVVARARGWDILRGGERVGRAYHPIDVTAVLEGAIYQCLPEWHPPPRVILHAACVAFGDRPVIFLGDSGVGKSSLARAALGEGASYLTDDLTITDGETVWGIARTIQFDPMADGEPIPSWLGDVDLQSYPLRMKEGQPAHMPLVRLPRDRVCRTTLEAQRVLLVLPRRATATRLEPLAHVSGLAALHTGAIGPLATNLGALVGPGRVWQLSWSSPGEAIRLLLEDALGLALRRCFGYSVPARS
jgi:hypothetical protein